ncbi:MAG: VanZ family protein [Clostridia bacterium]|nr:VanZ family protein [Clostridia bacterium]
MTPLSKPKLTLTHALFSLYFLFIVWTVLFKNSFSFNEIQALTRPRTLNLIPFYYDCDVSIRFHISEVLMNTVLFFPFGVYLKMLDIPSRKAIVSGLLLSFALEFCQFAFALGSSDITDLITNTLGTASGVCLYLLTLNLFKNKKKINTILSVLALTATILLGLLLLLLYLANR